MRITIILRNNIAEDYKIYQFSYTNFCYVICSCHTEIKIIQDAPIPVKHNNNFLDIRIKHILLYYVQWNTSNIYFYQYETTKAKIKMPRFRHYF